MPVLTKASPDDKKPKFKTQAKKQTNNDDSDDEKPKSNVQPKKQAKTKTPPAKKIVGKKRA